MLLNIEQENELFTRENREKLSIYMSEPKPP